MQMLVKKMALAASVALATLIAAQTAYAQRHDPAPEAHDTQAHQHSGLGPHVTSPPNGVMSGNRQIGSDPDPFIRGEMLRHSDSGWPD